MGSSAALGKAIQAQAKADAALATAINPTQGIFNYSPARLFKWRAALAKQRRGIYRPKLLLMGDSKTFGRFSFANTNAGYNLARLNGYPPQLAAQLTARGIPAENDNFYTSNYLSLANLLAADTRVTVTGGWTTSVSTANATSTYSNNGTAGNLNFAPASAFDTADIYYFPNNTNPFTISVDGTANTVVTPIVTGSMAKATITTTLGVHTINLVTLADNLNVSIQGIDTYVNANKSISVFNAGLDGGVAPAYVVSSANPNFTIPVLKPDLTILNMITNDMRVNSGAGTSESIYKANMSSLITAAQQNGDVVLFIPPPMDPTVILPATYVKYIQYVKYLASTYGCVVIDASVTWPSWNTTFAMNLWGDSLHENAAGYGEIARLITNVIANPL